MFTQVVSSVYSLIEKFQPFWKTIKTTEPVPTLGTPYEIGPEPVSVNIDAMIRNFRLGIRNLMEIWRIVLAP